MIFIIYQLNLKNLFVDLAGYLGKNKMDHNFCINIQVYNVMYRTNLTKETSCESM